MTPGVADDQRLVAVREAFPVQALVTAAAIETLAVAVIVLKLA
jgi:hypothetical protein